MRDGSVHERVALDLARDGWSVQERFLDAALAGRLREGALRLHRAGSFRPAAVGRGAERQIDRQVRREELLWLRPPCEPAQDEYLDQMNRLRLAINREMLLGLFDFEAHLALFPAGGAYERHLDPLRGARVRVVSSIVYLNPDWSDADGGCLRLYFEDGAGSRDIAPRLGTLVTFLSARFPHEVLPARRPRLSISGWFRARPMGPMIPVSFDSGDP